MKRHKVLLIIPEMSMGGAQRSLAKLSLALESFHEVSLVVFNTDHKVEYPHGGILLSLGVAGGGNVLQKFSSFIKRTRRLRKLKNKLRIDVSISFLEGADYVNVLSRAGDRVVL